MQSTPTLPHAISVLQEFFKEEGISLTEFFVISTAKRMLGLQDWLLATKPSPRSSAVILQNAVREQDILVKLSQLQDVSARVYGFADWSTLQAAIKPGSGRSCTCG